MSWLAAFVEGKQEQEFERRVNEELEGYEAYYPRGRKMIRARKAKKLVQCEYPAFPNYVFVRHPDSLMNGEVVYPLWRIPCLRYILCTGGVRTEIDDDSIEAIKRAQEEGLFDQVGEDKRTLFTPGTAVMVNKGYLYGRKGMVQMRAGNNGMALILVDGMRAKINVDFLQMLRQDH